jgi:hypothetical protein
LDGIFVARGIYVEWPLHRFAAAVSRRRVATIERLAAGNLANHAPELARSLNNLSVDLAASGDRAGGLAVIRRSVELREQLALENFSAHAPGLARSLWGLACLLFSDDQAATTALLERTIHMVRPFAIPDTDAAETLQGAEALLRRCKDENQD